MNEETEVSRLRNDHPGKTHMVIYLQWLLCIKSRSYIRSNWERLANEFCYLARMWMFHLPADHSYRTHSLVQSSISTRRYPCPLLVHFLWRVLLRSCFSFLLWTESLGNHLRVWQEINKPMKKPIRNEIKQHTSLKEADNLSLIAIFVESCSINARETT